MHELDLKKKRKISYQVNELDIKEKTFVPYKNVIVISQPLVD